MFIARLYINNQQIGAITALNVGKKEPGSDTYLYDINYNIFHENGEFHKGRIGKLEHNRTENAEVLLKRILLAMEKKTKP